MALDPEVLVIGCGPGGSTAATLLSRAGHRVMVLERERFPRFHIGESLLPYNRSLFEELGVWPALAAAGFPRKFGAQFHLANGTKSHRFNFRRGAFTRQTEAIQVERAVFDQLLMEHARRSGADIHEGWTVTGFAREPQGIRVQVADHTGQPRTLRARFLVDASGRSNLTGNLEDLRVIHPRHRKIAVFAHFTGIRSETGEAGGDTVIVRADRRWFWLIPISDIKTSVGLVLDKADWSPQDGDPAGLFHAQVRASPVMRTRMAGAEPAGSFHTTADFSYTNRRLVGPRLIRVGDAAGFMDPIFSSGVYLAMWSAKLASGVIHDALASGGDGARGSRAYERRLRAAFRLYWRMIEGFYTTPFVELFLEPGTALNLPAAVLAVLAGELEGGWRVRWRLKLFHLLVRIQARYPLVPRIRMVTEDQS